MEPMQLVDTPVRGRTARMQYRAPMVVRRCCGAERCGRFSPMEWLLIADATQGSGIRLQASSLRSLFGEEELAPSGKIGALSRMARWAARSGWSAPASEMAAFLRAGWCEEQLATLITAVEPADC